MNFSECVSWLKTMLSVQLNDDDANFLRILPAMFLYADGRIYRELTFLATRITQPVRLVAGNREFALPSSVRVLQSVNVLSPAGPITNTSTRKLLERISPEALDFFWPQASYKPGLPQKYAIVGNVQPVPQQLAQPFSQPLPPVQDSQVISHTVRLMPQPDKSYYAELFGDIRPEPLSSDNPETYLSVYYPELFLCACMVFGTGYQRDFGAQSDDPQRAVSWEGTYNLLRQGVALEATRMRGSLPPVPAAPAPR
jgi:hypothetical protein